VSDIDPFAHPPVYKADQVILMQDLTGWITGMERCYYKSTNSKFKKQLASMMLFALKLQDWLDDGKPADAQIPLIQIVGTNKRKKKK
jgi:ABC-type enterochelin transport system permease subunit